MIKMVFVDMGGVTVCYFSHPGLRICCKGRKEGVLEKIGGRRDG